VSESFRGSRIAACNVTVGIITLLFALPGLPSSAADTSATPVPPKLSMREAVRLTLDHSPRVKESRVSYLSAKSGLASAKDLRNTDVFASVTQQSVGDSGAESSASGGGQLSWRRRGGSSLSATVVPLSTSNLTSTMQLQYTRPIFRGSGQNSDSNVSIVSAEFGLATQEDQLFMAYQTLVQQTVRNYFDAVRTRDLIVVSESDVTIAKETVRMARRKLEEGLVAEIELSQAQIQLAQSEDQLVSRKRAYQDALDQLLLTMGLNVGQKPELTDLVPQERMKLDQEVLVNEALNNRKELSVLEFGVKRQKLELNVSVDDQRPGVDVVGAYTKAGLGLGGSDYSSSSHWSAGLEYSLPIGSVSRRERREIAKRQLDQLLVEQAFQHEEIKNEVLSAVRQMESAEASIGILEANLTVAESNLKTAQRMIDEGLRPYRDLLDAQVSLTRTRSSLLSSQIDYYLALVGLNRAIGRDLADDLTGRATLARK